MSALSKVSSNEIIAVLKSFGFTEAPLKEEGFHSAFTRRYKSRALLVIVPKGEDIPKGTLRSIVDRTELSLEEFLERLTEVKNA